MELIKSCLPPSIACSLSICFRGTIKIKGSIGLNKRGFDMFSRAIAMNSVFEIYLHRKGQVYPKELAFKLLVDDRRGLPVDFRVRKELFHKKKLRRIRQPIVMKF